MTTIRIGDWLVNPSSGEISRNGETVRVEWRTMRLLVCLAERHGEVVSVEDLISQVWGEVSVSPDSVYQAVASLRRVLGDDPKQPVYIATVPRVGYRLVAAVESVDSAPANGGRKRLPHVLWIAGVAACLVVTAAWLVHASAQPQKSIAVLPFLDLTDGMTQGPFADGMTEELIGRLSKIPGLRVPSATSSFFYKGKQIPITEIAKALGVAYVMDGSVRKSGDRVRIAARLVRADSGYVVWSETYERPLNDVLMVQDGIAGQVTKALGAYTR
jgi:transcriptional activator of cad operon